MQSKFNETKAIEPSPRVPGSEERAKVRAEFKVACGLAIRFVLLVLLSLMFILVQNGMQIGKLASFSRLKLQIPSAETLLNETNDIQMEFLLDKWIHRPKRFRFQIEILCALTSLSMFMCIIAICLIFAMARLNPRQRLHQNKIERISKVLFVLMTFIVPYNFIIYTILTYAIES
ncbi:hypothetical protein ACOME3_000194 [Neoechinorhynchus agilis]